MTEDVKSCMLFRKLFINFIKEVGKMLVNMSSVKRQQVNSLNNRANGSAMSTNGISAAFSGILSKFSYGSPAFVSVTTP